MGSSEVGVGTMQYRRLGATGAEVSEVSMGCNRLGEPINTPEEWDRLVRRAIDLGVNLFDTSENYGKGKSEEVLGRAVGNRDDVLIASKAAPKRGEDGHRDCSADVVAAAAERSLVRLRRSAIDIYQVHSPSLEELQESTWAEGMRRLRDHGKVRFVAVAIRAPDDGVWLIENGLVDVLQVTYNIFDTEAGVSLLPLAEDHGVGILSRMPLARGVLTGKFDPGRGVPEGHRASLDGEKALSRLPRVAELAMRFSDYPGGLTRLALHYALSNSAVSCIIPGARSIDQLEENVAAANGNGLPAEVLDEIERTRAAWS